MHVTRAGRVGVRQPCVWLAVVVGLQAAAGCSNSHQLELTLRLRNGVGPSSLTCSNTRGDPEGTTRSDSDVICRYDIQEQIWSDGMGRSAVEAEHSYADLEYNSEVDYGTTQCGGRTLTDVWYGRSEPYGDQAPIVLRIDDGSTIELVWERTQWASGFTDSCSVATGSWRGTAGDRDKRHGTYTMVNDSLQTVLHVVEN